MHGLYIRVAIMCILFGIYLALLIPGLLRKRRNLVFASVPVFGFFLFMAVKTVFVAVPILGSALKTRKQKSVYERVFGKPASGCVRIVNCFDPVIPIIDDALYLYFRSCPAETRRIVSQADYLVSKIPSSSLEYGLNGFDQHWFTPSAFGDSLWYFEYNSPDLRRHQFVYVSLDSATVYYVDID